jgi:rhodanese-related sulfurtransferase
VFVDGLVQRLPERPPTVELVLGLNSGAVDRRRNDLVRLLGPPEVAGLQAEGAAVLDGRPAEAFDAGAIRGSLSLPLEQPGVGTRAAWTVDPGAPVVAVGDDVPDALELVGRLEAVGFLDVRGVLAGGVDAWIAEGRAIAQTQRLDLDEVAARLRDGSVTLVDLRDDCEYQEISVPGSLHVPWRELRERAPEILAAGDDLVVACATGRRTPLGASILAREGNAPVARIAEGGVPDLAALLEGRSLAAA